MINDIQDCTFWPGWGQHATQPFVTQPFAGEILFPRSAMEVGKMLDSLVAELSESGLVLNADKGVILTSQSQPPSTVTTDHGIAVIGLSGNVAQKWLGCFSTADGLGQKIFEIAIPSPVQQAAKAYSCQQIDFGGTEGSNFSASPLFGYSMIQLFHRHFIFQRHLTVCISQFFGTHCVPRAFRITAVETVRGPIRRSAWQVGI